MTGASLPLAAWLLVGLAYPLWVLAGLLDWACHRRTGIERTAGLPENLTHWLLYLQGGVGVLGALLLQPTGGLLLIVAGVFLAHELTVWLELRYTVPRREVSPAEQMVHSVQEMVPLLALALLALLAGGRATELSLQLRPLWQGGPWPWAALATGLAATALLNMLPLAEESLRCLRARKRTPARPAP